MATKWVLAVIVAFVVAVQTTTTRGQVTDPDRHPIPGADILIGNASGVLMATRTDSSGNFRFFHSPLATRGQHMLICAPSYGAQFRPEVTSALIHSGYVLLKYRPGFQATANEEGWEGTAPPSCPSKPSTPAR